MPKPPIHQIRIDVTPLIGVLITLVVVMMVTTPTSIVSTALDLPPAVICDCLYVETVTVSVRHDGQLQVNDQTSSLDTLAADICLAEPSTDCRNTRIYLDGSFDASYGDFAATVDQLRAEGFNRMALINKDVPQP